MRKLFKKEYSLPCFYCGADSTELKIFLILVIGGLVLSSIFVFFGLYIKGRFKNVEDISSQPLDCENEK